MFQEQCQLCDFVAYKNVEEPWAMDKRPKQHKSQLCKPEKIEAGESFIPPNWPLEPYQLINAQEVMFLMDRV